MPVVGRAASLREDVAEVGKVPSSHGLDTIEEQVLDHIAIEVPAH